MTPKKRSRPKCQVSWSSSHSAVRALLACAIAAFICAFVPARLSGLDSHLPKVILSNPAGGPAKSASPQLAGPGRNLSTAERILQDQTVFGRFPPRTEAERELERMLRGKDADIDLALANWLVAADVPQFGNLTREGYFERLDAITEQVRQDMVRRRKVARLRGKNPDDPDTRCAIFCGAMIKLGFAYREEFAQHDLTPSQIKDLHADANNTFLAGLLRSMRGSCVSMPLVYAVIGQRLGLPVHLVHIGKHCFIRWQEPGYRINIETTRVDHVWVTDDDSAYIEDEKMTRDQVRGNELRNLSNREVIGGLLFVRSSYWLASAERNRVRSWMDLSRAFHLAPEDPAIAKTYKAAFDHYGLKPDSTLADLGAIETEIMTQQATLSTKLPTWALSPSPASSPQHREDGAQRAELHPASVAGSSLQPIASGPVTQWDNLPSGVASIPAMCGTSSQPQRSVMSNPQLPNSPSNPQN